MYLIRTLAVISVPNQILITLVESEYIDYIILVKQQQEEHKTGDFVT